MTPTELAGELEAQELELAAAFEAAGFGPSATVTSTRSTGIPVGRGSHYSTE